MEEAEAKALKDRKAAEDAKKAELAALFKPAVQQQKVPFGVDPKTVLCAYFKAGQCQKGDKCKFSHDPNVERKAAKINIYQDQRDLQEADEDRMENWDEAKLSEVVTSKHGPGIKTTTELVCNHFMDAIEQRKYGWFWECPNGDKCKYRHALPPGFVLRSKEKAGEEAKEEISLEDFLETERHRIQKGMPVTAESFAKWKLDRRARQAAEEAKLKKTREAEAKAGRFSSMSGRDLFTYQPDLFLGGDDDEAMEVDYTKREDSDQEEEAAVDASLFLDESLENLQIDDDDDEDAEE
jgi:ssDNA-binding Zn-finger/Zn-ribbon topoisomerase 1